ncbi:MAG: aminodeoxychorismate synthase component I [Planctomycetota bacterium]|nr:aminodeoxychorismate synthase component I [Planctomycetota bacterium]
MPASLTAAPTRPRALRLPAAGPWRLPPVAWAAAWQAEPGFCWLDHGGPDGAAGWSFLACRPAREWALPAGEALRALETELAAWRPREGEPCAGGPPFRGGWLAVLGYDLGREIERIPARATPDLPFPELYLARHEWVLAYEHRAGAWWVAGLAAGDEALRAEAERRLAQLPPPRDPGAPFEPPARAWRSNFAREEYEAAVRRALEYIAAGDVYQVNLSQRFEIPWAHGAWELYRRLRGASPASHAALVRVGAGRCVASISPELLLRARGREALTRPIKGTRPRGRSPAEDAAFAAELEGSAKDRAELNMIVDLERNDLGRLCEFGSVEVASPGELERHPTVFHRVATVRGRLRERVGAGEILRAVFPGGSVTGAPKIRAMQLIEELEPTRRGPYCGAIGWFGAGGDLELNLAIRTALADEASGRAWFQAGGGIVADSDPRAEYEETLAKAAAFFRAANARPMP